jgi:urease accessory protein
MKSRQGSDRLHRHAAGVGAFSLCSVLLATPASAHHAIGGATPSNGWEGLLSGLAHPVLGLDHLAFVLAAGLIAALHRRGVFIPIAFVAASLLGTGVHRLALNLPAPELGISLSVLLFGALLVARRRSLPLSMVLASASGVFHGYAYGQSIVGAEMTPLWAYLLGLALVQLAMGLSTQSLFQIAIRRTPEMGIVTLRWAGFVVCCVGLAYLSTQWVG